MSMKELSEALKEKKLLFGIRQVSKLAKAKKIKKSSKVFVAKDVRDETIQKLESSKVEFEVLKTKEEIAKALDLDFESEVYLIL